MQIFLINSTSNLHLPTMTFNFTSTQKVLRYLKIWNNYIYTQHAGKWKSDSNIKFEDYDYIYS